MGARPCYTALETSTETERAGQIDSEELEIAELQRLQDEVVEARSSVVRWSSMAVGTVSTAAGLVLRPERQ